MAQRLDNAVLGHALLEMVRGLNFDAIRDTNQPTQKIAHFPSLDLAVVAFPKDASPIWANVLFSRDFPAGVLADTGPQAGAVRNIKYLADHTDAQQNSVAWLAHSDWDAIPWKHLAGAGEHRFVAPYPASLIKLMVAVGVGRVVDSANIQWDDAWPYGAATHTVAQWTESMLVASNNDATSSMVALLHAHGVVESTATGETNHLEQALHALGLNSLRLSNTQPDGGWRNADGAGVGHLQMTAWDTVRLLWLLAKDLPAPPWHEASGTPLLGAESQGRLWGWLVDQGLHEILSSTLIVGVPGWQTGIPAQLPARWIKADGAAQVEDYCFPPDVRQANAQASVVFAHKTGNTDNYSSDAGLVTGVDQHARKYLIAMTSNIGQRYAPAGCVTDWRIPQLGAAVDAWMCQHLE